MVSVAVSKLDCSELFFVEPRVKVDGRYYHKILLKKQMLPVMRRIARDTRVTAGQCTSAPCPPDSSAAAAGDTTVHLADLWPANSPDN